VVGSFERLEFLLDPEGFGRTDQAQWKMDLSTSEKVTFIVARSFGLLSILSSICVAQEAAADWRHKETNNIVTRLQALMQIPLFLHGLVNMVGTTAAPSNQEIWLAAGTATTCSLQGWALQFSVSAGVCLDILLSLSFLFAVKYGWNEHQMRNLELVGQIFIWPYAVIISVFPLIMGLYGHVHEVCYIRVPITCDKPDDDFSCVPTPPIMLWIRLWLFFQNLMHVTVSLYVIAQIYSFARLSQSESIVRRVAVKGVFYAVSVAILQVPFCIWGLWLLIVGQSLHALHLVIIMILPLVGFMNMLVFMLNRREMRTVYGSYVRRTVDFVATSFCCCFRNDSYEDQKNEIETTEQSRR